MREIPRSSLAVDKRVLNNEQGDYMPPVLNRRDLFRGAALTGGGLALSAWMPAWAQPVSAGIVKPPPTVTGNDITLKIAHQMMMIDGRGSNADGFNGTETEPVIRLHQGETGSMSVSKDLKE